MYFSSYFNLIYYIYILIPEEGLERSETLELRQNKAYLYYTTASWFWCSYTLQTLYITDERFSECFPYLYVPTSLCICVSMYVCLCMLVCVGGCAIKVGRDFFPQGSPYRSSPEFWLYYIAISFHERHTQNSSFRGMI